MNTKTVKLVAVPILGVVFVYVLYQQYGTPIEQPAELAVQSPQRNVSDAKIKEQKDNSDPAKALSVKSLGTFNPFARSQKIESLYQQPSVLPSTSPAPAESTETMFVSKSETYLKLPSESLQATFEGASGWVAMIDSKTYEVGDPIVNENGEQFGFIVEISAGNVLISHRQSNIQ